METDEYAQVLEGVHRVLSDVVKRDWSLRAGTLEWTCWQTVDHMVDCVFSYAMQVAGREQTDFLPFGELHADSEAANGDLLAGLGAVGQMLGLRWGEAVGLRVPDVDFLRRIITVAQTVEEVGGQLRLVTGAKTRSSLRTMAVPAFLIDALADHVSMHRAANTNAIMHDAITV